MFKPVCRIILRYLTLIALATLLLPGCRSLYVPNTLHVPMLAEKGQFHGQAIVGTSGFDLGAAWSPYKHIGIMGNFSTLTPTERNGHVFGETAVGYYHEISPGIVADIWGGAGIGKYYTFEKTLFAEFSDEAHATRFFLQPSAGYSGSSLEFNCALRTNWLMMRYSSSARPNVKAENDFILEPVCTLKFGWRNTKWMIQAGFSSPVSGVHYTYSSFLFNTGFCLNLGKNWAQ